MNSKEKRRNNVYIEKNYKSNNKKKNIWKLICLISFICMIFIYYQVFVLFKYTMGKNVTEKQMSVYKMITGIINHENKVYDDKMNIAVIGNITVNNNLTKAYTEENITNFNNIFKYVTFRDFDYTIASLNTPIVESKTKLEYNAPKALLKSLEVAGINLLVTATNNLSELDARYIEETNKSIKDYDMNCIGIKQNDTNYYIIEKEDIKIAVLAYVGEDYINQKDYINVYSKKQLEKDITEAKNKKVDGIIVFIDTLRSNEKEVKNGKKEMLKQILNSGVDVVISNDTVVQSEYDAKGYIAYSLGDYIGDQNEKDGDISRLLKISVTKKTVNKKVKTSFECKLDKTFVALSNTDKTKYKIVDLDKEINEFSENKEGNITKSEYEYLKKLKNN